MDGREGDVIVKQVRSLLCEVYNQGSCNVLPSIISSFVSPHEPVGQEVPAGVCIVMLMFQGSDDCLPLRSLVIRETIRVINWGFI